MILQQKRDQGLATRDPGGEIRISQSSLKTGQAPEKAVDQVTLRGRGGYCLVLNTGERAFYWEEDDSAVTITSSLKDENTLGQGVGSVTVKFEGEKSWS